MTGVRENRSPGGRQRTKRPKLDVEESKPTPVVALQTLDVEHADIINTLISSNPDRIPVREGMKHSITTLGFLTYSVILTAYCFFMCNTYLK